MLERQEKHNDTTTQKNMKNLYEPTNRKLPNHINEDVLLKVLQGYFITCFGG